MGDVSTPEYVHFRHWLEDEHFIFDVPAVPSSCLSHRDAQHGIYKSLYGCTTCGRAHWCRGEAERCLAALSSDGGGYVCLFSGRGVAGAEMCTGTWDLEQEAADPGYLRTTDTEPRQGSGFFATTTSAYGHTRKANNTSDDRIRRNELRKADNAKGYKASAIEASKMARAAPKRLREEFETEQETEDVVMLDAPKNPMHDEEVRDAAWSLANVAHLLPAFQTHAVAFEPPRVQAAAPARAPAPTRQLAVFRADRFAQILALVHIGITVLTEYASASGAPAAGGPAASPSPSPCALVVLRLAVLLDKRLETPQDRTGFVAALLLGVLSRDLITTDRFDARITVWVAEPWLHHVTHDVPLVMEYVKRGGCARSTPATASMRKAMQAALHGSKADELRELILAKCRQYTPWAVAAAIVGA